MLSPYNILKNIKSDKLIASVPLKLWFARDIFANLKNIVGGEISEYTRLQAESREQALQRMEEDAKKMGANAIINVRLTTSMVMQGCSEILAYGTAITTD